MWSILDHSLWEEANDPFLFLTFSHESLHVFFFSLVIVSFSISLFFGFLPVFFPYVFLHLGFHISVFLSYFPFVSFSLFSFDAFSPLFLLLSFFLVSSVWQYIRPLTTCFQCYAAALFYDDCHQNFPTVSFCSVPLSFRWFPNKCLLSEKKCWTSFVLMSVSG